jgi:hypothetical protein
MAARRINQLDDDNGIWSQHEWSIPAVKQEGVNDPLF